MKQKFWSTINIKIDKQIKKGAKVNDIEKLIELIDQNTFIGFRDTVAVLTLYKTGIRIQTLGELKERHIDYENLILNLDGSILKNHKFVQLILSADLNLYHFDKPEPSNFYDGKFTINGTTYNYGSEFKDETNKSLGAYSNIYIWNPVNNKTLTISEKEFPYAGNVGNMLNPYSSDEVKDILGIQFEETFDSKTGRLTIHFNKPAKEKYPGW